MIEFSPSRGRLELTGAQLSTISLLTTGKDAEVVDHESNTLITVYVGDVRHVIHEDGKIIGAEHGVEQDGDWEWTPVEVVEPSRVAPAEILHEAVETFGQDKFECGIIRVNADRQPVAYAQLGGTTVCIARGADGRVGIEIDDIAEEDVYVSANLNQLVKTEGATWPVPWSIDRCVGCGEFVSFNQPCEGCGLVDGMEVDASDA